jgi:hypothetical protein
MGREAKNRMEEREMRELTRELQEQLISDAGEIITKVNEASKSELVAELRGRGWKMPAWYINGELETLLEANFNLRRTFHSSGKWVIARHYSISQ